MRRNRLDSNAPASGTAVALISAQPTSTEAPMTMFKTDYPRAIDRLIDYFGERGTAAPATPPRPAKAALVRVA